MDQLLFLSHPDGSFRELYLEQRPLAHQPIA